MATPEIFKKSNSWVIDLLHSFNCFVACGIQGSQGIDVLRWNKLSTKKMK